MDYVWTVNGKEVICKSILQIHHHDASFVLTIVIRFIVKLFIFSIMSNCSYSASPYTMLIVDLQVFQMSQPDITNAILNSQLKLTLQVERYQIQRQTERQIQRQI